METSPRPEGAQGALWRDLWRWIDERLGLEGLSYPVPAHANSVLYTLGGISLFGVIVLIATGIYLTQFYHGDPTQARQSVEYIITTARLGDFFRSPHFWMANLVTITLLLHALRVFVTGAYRAPRELNWVVGVGLWAGPLLLVPVARRKEQDFTRQTRGLLPEWRAAVLDRRCQ